MTARNENGLGMDALLWDADRVDHDPSVQVRRAYWLGLHGIVQQSIMPRGVPIAPTETTYLIHDLMALPRTTETDRFVRRAIEYYPEEVVLLLQRNADVFVAIAAVGDRNKLGMAIKWVEMADKQNVFRVDLARMIEVACVNDFNLLVNSLLRHAGKLRPVHDESANEALRRGLQRAVDQLVASGREDIARTMVQAIKAIPVLLESVDDHLVIGRSPIDAAVNSESANASLTSEDSSAVSVNTSTEISGAIGVIAFRVMTNARLIHQIGKYQETLGAALSHFKQTSQIWSTFPYINQNEGVHVRTAIIENNMYILQVVYQLSRARNHRCDRSFDFDQAMHLAACEGRIHILEWLHKLPGDAHRCRPDTMASAVRCGWAGVVEWLHLHCPESSVTMSELAINDAMRSNHFDVVKTCIKYQLGAFTTQTLGAMKGCCGDCVDMLKRLQEAGWACPVGVYVWALRTGRAQELEWLHLQWKEAIEDVQQDAINEAIHKRHYDVIRVCLQLSIGEFTASALVIAAEAADNEILELITSYRKDLSTREAMDAAIKCGNTSTVQWLHDHADESIDVSRLLLCLTSPIAMESRLQSTVVSLIDPSSDVIKSCAIEHFDEVCARGTKAGIRLLAPFVMEECRVQRDEKRETGNINPHVLDIATRLRQVLEDDCEHLAKTVADAYAAKELTFVRALLLSGVVTDAVLAQLFQDVVQDAKTQRKLCALLIQSEIHLLCADSFTLSAKHDLSTLKLLYDSRTREAAITALRDATDVTTVQFLLANETRFYTRRIVLENAPQCALPLVVRLLADTSYIDYDEALRADYYSNFELSLEDLCRVVVANDAELTRFVAVHHVTLIKLPLWIEALQESRLDVLAYLVHDLKISLSNSESSPLFESAVVFGIQVALWKVFGGNTPDRTTPYVNRSHAETLVAILKQQPTKLQAQTMTKLVQSLCERPRDTRTRVAPQFQSAVECLGDMFIDALPTQSLPHRQKLLVLAAETGSEKAVEALLGGEASTAPADLAVTQAMIIAARHGHRHLIEKLYVGKQPDEVVSVQSLRQAHGLSDASALQVVLATLEPLDESIRVELLQERLAATSLFGVPASSARGSASSTRPTARGKRPGGAKR